MPKKILIPVPFRQFTDGDDSVQTNAENVDLALRDLWSRFPAIWEPMTDREGKLRRFVNIYVNGEDIRFLKNSDTPIKDGDDISIIPALVERSSAVAAVAVAELLRAGRSSN